jgi:hypothetical protein
MASPETFGYTLVRLLELRSVHISRSFGNWNILEVIVQLPMKEIPQIKFRMLTSSYDKY